MFARAAAAYTQLRGSEILRIGGKMSGVRGTDCDPAELHRICGVRVNDDVSADDIYKIMKDVSRDDAARLVQQWATKYDIVPELKEGGARYEEALHNAKLSLSIDKLVNEGKYIGWTSYFGTLNPINTLPAMCAQESMARGMAYGAEGDVSAATVVAAQLIMGQGLKGASSFSEPYVFDWESESILHAHMAESNPELAGKNKVRAEIHKLDIGKSGEPVRLIFDFAEGDCTLTSLFSTPPIGYQLMTADGEIIPTPKLPKLPTARGLVRFKGGLETAIECQAYAGETHHPALSTALNRDYMATLARMWGIPHHAVKEGTNSEDFADRLELLRAIYR
jgi:L-arabinose isomerase